MSRPYGSVNVKESVRYSKPIFKDICDRIAGGESLLKICRDEGYPSASAVVQWVMDDKDGCSKYYDKARMVQAALYADEIVGISDDGANDTYEKDLGDGKTVTVTNTDVIQRSRLRVDARKWILSKVLPKVYGDKLDLKHDGNVGVHHTGFGFLLKAAKAASADGSGEEEEIEGELGG